MRNHYLDNPKITFWASVVVSMLFLVICIRGYYNRVNELRSERLTKSAYHDVPFESPYNTVITRKEEFDSLGIHIVFSAQSIRQWKMKSKDTFFQSFWLPKTFILREDDYFIWLGGNKMDVFLSQKAQHPKCRFLFIGEKLDSVFTTREMYIVY